MNQLMSWSFVYLDGKLTKTLAYFFMARDLSILTLVVAAVYWVI